MHAPLLCSSSIHWIVNEYLKFVDHCEGRPGWLHKAPGTTLVLVEFPFSFPPRHPSISRGYTVTGWALSSWNSSRHCVMVISTKQDRKLLVVSNHRIQMPNVPSHQENLTILAQSEDRKAETANCGGVSSTQTAPEASNCRHAFLRRGCGGPCGVGHGLCSSRPVSSWSIWLSPGMSMSIYMAAFIISFPAQLYNNFFKIHYKTLPIFVCDSLFSPSLSLPFSFFSLPPTLSLLSFFNNCMYHFLPLWLRNWFFGSSRH